MIKPWRGALLPFALLLCGLARAAAPAAPAAIQVDAAWVRAVPAVSTNSAAFMSIHNRGKSAVVLTGVSSPAAAAAELHVMSMAGGVMRMDRLPAARIAPGGELLLSPGEKHIMLIGLKHALHVGQHVPVQLQFRNAGVVNVDAIVKADTD